MQPLRPQTINSHLHLLSEILARAVREGLLARNPAEGEDLRLEVRRPCCCAWATQRRDLNARADTARQAIYCLQLDAGRRASLARRTTLAHMGA